MKNNMDESKIMINLKLKKNDIKILKDILNKTDLNNYTDIDFKSIKKIKKFFNFLNDKIIFTEGSISLFDAKFKEEKGHNTNEK